MTDQNHYKVPVTPIKASGSGPVYVNVNTVITPQPSTSQKVVTTQPARNGDTESVVRTSPNLAGLEPLESLYSLELATGLVSSGGGCGKERTFTVKDMDMCGIGLVFTWQGTKPVECCGQYDDYIRIKNAQDQTVLNLKKHTSLCSRSKMDIYSSNYTLLGSVEEETSVLTCSFLIRDPSGSPILRILRDEGWYGSDLDFWVLTGNCLSIGRIRKKWKGVWAKGDTYELSFPIQFNTQLKAVLLGSMFLINDVLFEGNTGVAFGINYAIATCYACCRRIFGPRGETQ